MIMKKLILITMFAGTAVCVSAQTTGTHASKNTGAVSSAASHKKSMNTKSSSTVQLNNRRNYMFKNGQESTPTGYQATGTNGDEFVSPKKKLPAKNIKHS
jgi:hypothetical protein